MNYDSIREKYPRAYKALTQWVQPHLIAYYNHIDEFPFAYQVGLLEEFFDEAGIVVKIDWEFSPAGKIIWLGEVYLPKYPSETDLENTEWLPSRVKARKAAFTKAFELLESKLP